MLAARGQSPITALGCHNLLPGALVKLEILVSPSLMTLLHTQRWHLDDVLGGPHGHARLGVLGW